MISLHRLQALPHKPPLAKAQPPLTWLASSIRIQPNHQPRGQLLPHLPDVSTQGIGLIPILGRLVERIEGESRITRQGEVIESRRLQCLFVPMRRISPQYNIPSLPPSSSPSRIHPEELAYLLSIAHAHGWLDPPQTLRDPQDSIDQHAVGGALDLKVAEESVCAEQRQRLVQDVVRFAVRVDV